ncbi:DUF1295 domain-containing protein [Jatrophihabitans sp. YIM 134969]
MNTFDTSGFVAALPWTAGAVLALIAVTFVAAQLTHRNNVVDAVWGLLFVAAGWAAFAVSGDSGDDLRRWLLVGMVTLWGGRLGVNMLIRSRGKGEDPRYEKLLERGHGNPTVNAVLKIFLPQAVLAWLISSPLQVGPFQSGPVGWLAWVGVAVWAVGLYFEAVGDAQMNRYRAWKSQQPKDEVKASVMDRGLWRYTRHPNYFGDACVWTGMFLVTAEHWPGILTLPSLLIMVYLLVFGSGKRNQERTMSKRPGYPEYMERTSGFFPLPPKKRPQGPESKQPTGEDVSVTNR